MAKNKPIAATSASLWFCEEGHLHVALLDEDGDEIAFTALPMEEGLEALGDLLVDMDEDHGISLHAIVAEGDDDEEDDIGPTMGSC